MCTVLKKCYGKIKHLSCFVTPPLCVTRIPTQFPVIFMFFCSFVGQDGEGGGRSGRTDERCDTKRQFISLIITV